MFVLSDMQMSRMRIKCWEHFCSFVKRSARFNVHKFGLDGFTNCIFANLDVMETFGRHTVGPVDAGGIIVIDIGGAGHSDRKNVKIFKDVMEVLELFVDAFVRGVDFGFGGAASSNGLAFGRPGKSRAR